MTAKPSSNIGSLSVSNHSADLPAGSAPPASEHAKSILLPPLSLDEFRRKLAGLADPRRRMGAAEPEEVKDAAIRFVSILAGLFGHELDRVTLWSRIGSALQVAVEKVSDDDLDQFADLCLEHVQADFGKAAALPALTQLRETWAARPPEWRYALLGYVKIHAYAVLTHGRARWQRLLAEAEARRESGQKGIEVEL